MPHEDWRALQGPQDVQEALSQALYIASEDLATAIYLAMALGKPLLLEGAPGVGKTEAAKALSSTLSCELIRLQCYEGIDANTALYEWNFPRQILAMRQANDAKLNIYDPEFLIARPLLQALHLQSEGLLLIDEIDRADHEFEAFLLEFLSETVEWADAATRLKDLGETWPEAFRRSIGVVLKEQDDLSFLEPRMREIIG